MIDDADDDDDVTKANAGDANDDDDDDERTELELVRDCNRISPLSAYIFLFWLIEVHFFVGSVVETQQQC